MEPQIVGVPGEPQQQNIGRNRFYSPLKEQALSGDMTP